MHLKTISLQYCYCVCATEGVCQCRHGRGFFDALCQAFRILRKESESHAWLWQRYLHAKNIEGKNEDTVSYHFTTATPQHYFIFSMGHAVHTHTHTASLPSSNLSAKHHP